MGYSQIVDMDVYGDGEEGGEDDMTEEEFRAMLAEVYYWPMFFILFLWLLVGWLINLTLLRRVL